MATGPHLILFYDYIPDVVERRAPHREAHLGRIGEEVEAGRIVMAGALGDPPTGAAIVFAGVDVAAVEAFADADPYVRNGLVTARRVVPWTVVASA
ncbi:MAG: YciI family protein [Thermoleophilia bacterium]